MQINLQNGTRDSIACFGDGLVSNLTPVGQSNQIKRCMEQSCNVSGKTSCICSLKLSLCMSKILALSLKNQGYLRVFMVDVHSQGLLPGIIYASLKRMGIWNGHFGIEIVKCWHGQGSKLRSFVPNSV